MSVVITFLKLSLVFRLGFANVIPVGGPYLKQVDDALVRDVIVGEDPDFKCPGYGAWPHPERCELYYTCYLGEPTYVWQCRKDYLFDTNYYGCNFPELTDCGDRLRPGGESTITQRTTTTPVTPTPDPSFTCPADNGFFPAQPGVCQSNFYICVEGVAYAQTCPGNAVFDPVYLVCLPPSSANCDITTASTTLSTTTVSTTTTEGPFTCPSDNGVFPIRPEACTPYYYRCTDGEPYPTICPDDQIFDPSQSRCVAPELAACNHTDFTCPTSGGFYPYDECSEKYYVCVNGEAYVAVCPEGAIFDPNRGVCVPKSQYVCDGTTTVRTSTTGSPRTTITQAPTPGGNFTCPAENGNYPDPTDCHRFYVCVWGTPYLKICPGDLYYNPELEVCDYQENVPSCANGVPQTRSLHNASFLN